MNISRENAKRCVGPGWAALIDAIYDRLPEDAFIFQVKEKWSGLRFYVSGSSELLDFIDEMEAKSFETCEVCGQLGKPREGGWIRTLVMNMPWQPSVRTSFTPRLMLPNINSQDA
jgi:hypothetical protein